MGQDAGWARFDRLVDVFERAYIELACRRVAGPRWGDDITEAVRDIYAHDLREKAVFLDRAWLLALSASEVTRPSTVDLSDTLCDTLSYRVQLP